MQTEFNFKPDAILPNGARIVQFAWSSYFGCYIVLAFFALGTTSYVRWSCDKFGNAHWGHYHKELSEATIDYFKKLNEGNRNAT